MLRPQHRIRAAGAYFVNSGTWQRRALFRQEAAARILIDCMLHYRDQGHYLLHDFVVMPDHFHAILTPNEKTSLEKALQLIKGGSSHRMGKELIMRFPVWQEGFHEHWVRSQEDYERCRRYIHDNPVKAGIVEKPEAYLFSSASAAFRLDLFSLGLRG